MAAPPPGLVPDFAREGGVKPRAAEGGDGPTRQAAHDARRRAARVAAGVCRDCGTETGPLPVAASASTAVARAPQRPHAAAANDAPQRPHAAAAKTK